MKKAKKTRKAKRKRTISMSQVAKAHADALKRYLDNEAAWLTEVIFSDGTSVCWNERKK